MYKGKAYRVELGAIDDLTNEYKSIASKAVPLKNIIQKAANDLMQVSDKLDKVSSDAKKLQSMAKELGADQIVKSAERLEGSAKSLSSAWGKSALKASAAAKEI